MKRSVYIETTIPSFCPEFRTDRDIPARRAATRVSWDTHPLSYEFPATRALIAPLERGAFSCKDDAIANTVTASVSHHVRRSNPAGAALHLAAASSHKCDFAIT